ncbi:uncharacterized [Tachysurus ichikawai]
MMDLNVPSLHFLYFRTFVELDLHGNSRHHLIYNITATALTPPSGLYLQHCKRRACRETTASIHLKHGLFCLLASGKRYCSM